MLTWIIRLAVLLLVVFPWGVCVAEDAGMPMHTGQTIVFVGDSITVAAGKATGFGKYIEAGLKANGITLKSFYAAGSGANSRDMSTNKYLFLSAMARKPDWITISCGVNDAKVDGNACSIEDYRKNITAMVEQAQAANIQVMLLTSAAWECLNDDEYHRKIIAERNRLLQPYNDFLRTLAKEKQCRLADVNVNFQTIQTARFSADGVLTKLDGCHPNAAGHQVMARTMLNAFGATAAQMLLAEQAWTVATPEPTAQKP